jgi:hypothetical protein
MEKDRKMIFQGVSAPTYAEKGESTPSDGLTVDCLPRAPTPDERRQSDIGVSPIHKAGERSEAQLAGVLVSVSWSP